MKNKISNIVATAVLLAGVPSALAFDDPLAGGSSSPEDVSPAVEDVSLEEVDSFHAAAVEEESSSSTFLADVAGLTASSQPGSVLLAWNAVSGADGYTIYYDTLGYDENGGLYESQKLISDKDYTVEGSKVTYTVENLTDGQTYYFSVAAEDSTGVKNGSLNYSEEATVLVGDSASKEAASELIVEESSTPEPEEVEEVVVAEKVTTFEEVANSNSYTPLEQNSASASAEEPSKELPKSGPFAGFAVAAAAASAYFVRRRKAQK